MILKAPGQDDPAKADPAPRADLAPSLQLVEAVTKVLAARVTALQRAGPNLGPDEVHQDRGEKEKLTTKMRRQDSSWSNRGSMLTPFMSVYVNCDVAINAVFVNI